MIFLGLVNTLIRELGVLGGEPLDTVAGQTGEAQRIIGLVSDADWYIQNAWDDWKFHWATVEHVATVGSQSILLPHEIGAFPRMRRIIRDSLVLRPRSNNAQFPMFSDWHKFRRAWAYSQAVTSSDYPSEWSQKPDGSLLMSHKAATAYAYLYEYQRYADRLVNDEDVSIIPYNEGDEYDYPRIVIVRAKLAWAEIEDAPEIVASAVAEYRDLMQSLEADHLPGREQHQMSRADQVMTMQRP